jgi:hypothetical protein
MQVYLMNSLIFCAILLLIVLIVGAVQLTLIMIDLRRTVSDVTDKVRAVTSLLEIVTSLAGVLDLSKGRFGRKLPGKSTLIAFAAGLKKGLNVLFK